MLEMNARSLQQKLETERELKQRLMEEVQMHEHTLVFITQYVCFSDCGPINNLEIKNRPLKEVVWYNLIILNIYMLTDELFILFSSV